jgi:hypothetical protein
MLLTLMMGTVGLAFPVEVLRTSGPSRNRIDLVILGDGYRAQDQAQLTTDATTLINTLFANSWYRDFAPMFNVKLIHSESNETGGDRGTYGAMRDTRYGANYFCQNIERLICVNSGTVLADAMMHVPEYDYAVVLVNDPKYGGSGGTVPVISVNQLSSEILSHELGHTLARLADEYETPYPSYPQCNPTLDCSEANVTLRSTLAQLKWMPWVPAGTPIPTPKRMNIGGIGLFEGARYLTAGIYRPTENACEMRTLGAKSFCGVCGEGLTRALFRTARPVDSVTPDAGCTTPPAAFQLTLVAPAVGTFDVQWEIDGVRQGASGPSFTPTPGSLSNARSVRAIATYQSNQVRLQPAIQQQVEWRFSCGADGGVDAGRPLDAGVLDAGTGERDAGTTNGGANDAGDADAGPDAPDASTREDGGVSNDAGGAPGEDAGTDVAPFDGGSLVDQSPLPFTNERVIGQCGCASSDVSVFAGALSVAVGFRRRRKSS